MMYSNQSDQYIQLLGCRTDLRDVNGERVKLKVGLASDDMVSHTRGGQNLRTEPSQTEPTEPKSIQTEPKSISNHSVEDFPNPNGRSKVKGVGVPNLSPYHSTTRSRTMIQSSTQSLRSQSSNEEKVTSHQSTFHYILLNLIPMGMTRLIRRAKALRKSLYIYIGNNLCEI
ncbi:hypothetical protein YC2023_077231 [Brassica napus]